MTPEKKRQQSELSPPPIPETAPPTVNLHPSPSPASADLVLSDSPVSQKVSVESHKEIAAGAKIVPAGIRSKWENAASAEAEQRAQKQTSSAIDEKAARRRWKVIAMMALLAVFIAFAAAFKDLKTVGDVKDVTLIIIGKSLINLGATPLAMFIYDTNWRSDPKYSGVLVDWGITVSEKDPQEAIVMYNGAIKSNPNNSEAYMNRAAQFLALKNDAQALADYDKAISLNPNYSFAYCNRGRYFSDRKFYDKALADFDKAIETNGKFRNARRNFYWFYRGWCYFQMQRWQLAINDFTKCIQQGYVDTWVYNNRGYCLQQLGQMSKARDDYAMALKLDPKNATAAENLASLSKTVP